jgi:hypothetical protein
MMPMRCDKISASNKSCVVKTTERPDLQELKHFSKTKTTLFFSPSPNDAPQLSLGHWIKPGCRLVKKHDFAHSG